MLVPSQRYSRTAAVNSLGSAPSGTSPRNVFFGSALERTSGARTSPPPASATPTARPSSTRIDSGLGAGAHLAPRPHGPPPAIASVTTLMPPRTKPQARMPPSSVPSAAWSWSST